MKAGIIAIIMQSTLANDQPLFEIPREFWGEYNEIIADCGTGNNDSRLRISWNTLHFYESVGEIEELLRISDGSVVVIAKHSGEGRDWLSAYRLRLSIDSTVLTVVHPQTAKMQQFVAQRQRCPASRK